MKNILNITNGDSAVDIMKQANLAGEFLPWRDILHDGPVPENLSLEELSEIRAQFIVSRGWGTQESVRKSFIERDNELKSFGKYEKVILWFEHDLYDQLQILQILDWFHSYPTNDVELSIICTEKYLGMLSPDEMKDLVRYEVVITEKHLNLSSKAWASFRSGTPEKWYGLLNSDTSALPFLEGAIVRMLEEYPGCSNGLSRTAQQALKLISEGGKHPGEVFHNSQELEAQMFLGDSSFWVILQEFLECSPPLINLSNGNELTLPADPDQELTITPLGREVLAGIRNWFEIVELDRWVGGVHLKQGNVWCWDSDSRSLSKRA